MDRFDRRVSEHLASLPTQLTDMLAEKFRTEAVVHIGHLLPADLVDELHAQAQGLLLESARRRDLEIASTGGTPRAYLSVGRDAIFEDDGLITRFFESETVRDYLSTIAGEPLHKVPYRQEEYIINSQAQSGDTHGWHWDDYTFALIWMVEAPHCMHGGHVEYMSRTRWDKDNPRACLEDLISSREVRSRYIPSRTCYLMRANTTLHRVAPLTHETRRTVIVFTYASEADLTDSSISHETMEEIYSAELEAA